MVTFGRIVQSKPTSDFESVCESCTTLRSLSMSLFHLTFRQSIICLGHLSTCGFSLG